MNPTDSLINGSDSQLQRLEKRLSRPMGKAISEWNLLENGDRVLVGISGGKDSYTLLHLLKRFQARAPISFELVAVHLDQVQPGFDSSRIEAYLAELGVEFQIVRKDTYSLVVEKLEEGQTTCSLCSRYRRGILYNEAEKLGCNKLALGHHREDALETLLMNMFFSGRTAGMPAIYKTEDERFDVIRPMIYVAEGDIKKFAELMNFPIEPCTVCNGTERDQIGKLIDDLAERNPKIRGNLLQAMQNVVPSHLLDQDLG